MKKLHPLELWLIDHEMSLPVFAAKNSLPLRALYNHLDDEWQGDPKLSTMETIAKATGGKVTLQMQANWFRGRNG